MNCKMYQKHILSYLDGELHQKMANELNSHIQECKNCSDALAMLTKANSIIASEKSEFKADAFMAARILAKIKNKEVEYSSKAVSLRYYTVASLAAAGIAIGVLIGTLYSTNSPIQTPTAQEWDQLADEYMPEVENNPYNMVTTTNEIPAKP